MAVQHIMINDIISEQMDRMQNLKKYYPFFVLYESTFSQYKEGKYADLDMGYITIASLRFFINENNFNEKDITFEEYSVFMKQLLERDFLLTEESEDEMKELVTYIFDKIKNDGKAFEFKIFDPETHTKKISRIKLLESEVKDGRVVYHVTHDGIEFYLDTKETKDESKINVQQLLLEKMIKANNFKGGIDVVKRINGEVARLKAEKEQVIKLLLMDIYEGQRACDAFMEKTAKWFMDEQKLFAKNKALVDQAIKRASGETINNPDSGASSGTSASMALAEISSLENELKRTILNHSELISETTSLARTADEIIVKAKLKKLRTVFGFDEALSKVYKQDNVELLGLMLRPLFAPKIVKTFAISSIDNILTLKTDDKLKGEVIEDVKADLDFKYEDEILEEMVAKNFAMLFTELLERMSKWGKISLKELNAILEVKFGEEIYDNRDYYAFLVHLSEKDEYSLHKMFEKQDTMLEGAVVSHMTSDARERYKDMSFKLEYTGEMLVIESGKTHDAEDIASDSDYDDKRYIMNMNFVVTE